MDGSSEQGGAEKVRGLRAAWNAFKPLLTAAVSDDPSVAQWLYEDITDIMQRGELLVGAPVVLGTVKTITPPTAPEPRTAISEGEFALFVLALVKTHPDIRLNLIFKTLCKAGQPVGVQPTCLRRIKRLGENEGAAPLLEWPDKKLPPVRITEEGETFLLNLLRGVTDILPLHELIAFLSIVEPFAPGITKQSEQLRNGPSE